jgi:hypothetical protein
VIYTLIGKLVVAFVRWRFARELKIAAGVGIATAAVAGYLIATREPPEG